jgi:predicted Zn-dependent peptidase
MLKFDRFTLDNGLRFLVHRDKTTPLLAMNILYDVGSRDEVPDKTGFAHLFEHLMFGGSVNIPRYDEPLQKAGGENNAFTNSDITNYYLTLPSANAETAFWLESDRMNGLAFSEKSLETQRQVVVEEFRQNYLNQPYGDMWMLLRSLAYKVHPYQWITIGKDPAHIEQATMKDVKDFYNKHYHPGNAIVCVAGSLKLGEVQKLADKWFGTIPSGKRIQRQLPAEPRQLQAGFLKVERAVPNARLLLAFHMCAKGDADYYVFDLISDLLGSGHSSRLYQSLVIRKKLFSDINAFITGDHDPGLLVISGSLNHGVSHDEANEAVWKEIEVLRKSTTSKRDLMKVKNKTLANLAYDNISLLNRAMSFTFAEHLGDASLVNHLPALYARISQDDILRVAHDSLTNTNSNTIYYCTAK